MCDNIHQSPMHSSRSIASVRNRFLRLQAGMRPSLNESLKKSNRCQRCGEVKKGHICRQRLIDSKPISLERSISEATRSFLIPSTSRCLLKASQEPSAILLASEQLASLAAPSSPIIARVSLSPPKPDESVLALTLLRVDTSQTDSSHEMCGPLTPAAA